MSISETKTRGFTLMELLLVIALIAILLGIVVPTYYGVREHARATKARATVKHLETAFREYYNYYRDWPESGSGAIEIEGALFETMRGDNPDEIAFFEFETIKGAPDSETAYDPWMYDRDGNERWEPYRVQFDQNFNNQITHGGETIYRSVIVWSVGPDREDYTDDDIRSWE